MPTLQRILVPFRTSLSSRAALQYAVFLAERLGAQVELLHVAEPGEVRGNTDDVAIAFKGVPGSTLESYNEAEVQRALSAFVREAGLARDVRNEEIEQSDDPARFVLEHARARGIDLIVMGASDQKGLARRVLGSVARKVAESASCPVLTVRG